MAYEVRKVHVEGEFKACPVCGYEDGFHSMLKKKNGRLTWLFICPACHAVFDVGYTIEMTGQGE